MRLSDSAPVSLRDDIAELAPLPLAGFLAKSTFAPEGGWSREALVAYTAMLPDSGSPRQPVVVSTGALQRLLALQAPNRCVPENDHNYRRRYGDHGDREHWERILAANAAQKLPPLGLSLHKGRLCVIDEGPDATYVAAMLRDNHWRHTTVLVPAADVAWARALAPAELPRPALRPGFAVRYRDLIEEAMAALPAGTIIGEAIKLTSRPVMGMPRPEDEPDRHERERYYPRGNTWLHHGRTLTSLELVGSDLLPAPALMTQVHRILVVACNHPGRHRHDTGLPEVPEAVWGAYREAAGGCFAWHG